VVIAFDGQIMKTGPPQIQKGPFGQLNPLPPDRDACSFGNDKPFPIFDILLPDLKVDRRIFDRQVTSLTQMCRAT
jgi:hypothetical protein